MSDTPLTKQMQPFKRFTLVMTVMFFLNAVISLLFLGHGEPYPVKTSGGLAFEVIANIAIACAGLWILVSDRRQP